MVFDKIEFQIVNWDSATFTKWLRGLDKNWKWNTLRNTTRYIANGEIVAIIKFKHLYNYELFSEELKIRKDLLNSL